MPFCLLAAHLVGSTLLTFGGTGVPFGEATTNQVRLVNLKDGIGKWSTLACSGGEPDPKYGHVSILEMNGNKIME